MRKTVISLVIGLMLSVINLDLAMAGDGSSYQTAISNFYQKRDYVASKVVFQEIVSNSQTLVKDRAGAQFYVGLCEYGLKNYSEAMNEFELVVKNYPEMQTTAAAALWQMVITAKNMEDDNKVNSACMSYIQNYAYFLGTTSSVSKVVAAFNSINPTLLTGDEYKAFLENTIKAVKATEENANFLGRVKSELEKMK